MRFAIILFTNIFGGISVKRPLHRMRLTIKLGNWTDNEHSLTIVFSSRSFESRIRSCKLSSDIPWRKKALITIECFYDRVQFFRGRHLVFNLFRILLPLKLFFEIKDSTVEFSCALVIIMKSFIFQVLSIFVSHIIVQVTIKFVVLFNSPIIFKKSWLKRFQSFVYFINYWHVLFFSILMM